MMEIHSPSSASQRVWLVYLLFMSASVAGFLYCLLLGQFNGDFFPEPVFLPVWTLFAVLIACLLPHFLTFRLAHVLDAIQPKRRFQPRISALATFFALGSLAHIAATLLYGVGIMDRETYTAPPEIAPFIQVLNRIDPFYLGVFFILASPKRLSFDFSAIVVMISIGFLRAGLGVFNYVIIAMLVKYSAEVISMARRSPWLVGGAALGSPLVISSLYELRNQLRGHSQFNLDLSEILFGRFVGRLSAYSNVAFIEQNDRAFDWGARSLEPLYYVRQALQPLLGSGIAPPMTPEKLLIAGTQSYEGYSSFMTGVPGNLIMAWSVSPAVAILNLALTLTMVVAIIWLSRFLGGRGSNAFGLSMLVYPLTSGVASEFSQLLINSIIFVMFAIVFGRATDTPGARKHG